MKTIVYQFEKHAHLNPNAVAVTSGDQQWTYRQLNNYANYITQILVQRGIKTSSVIAVSGLKSIEMIAAIIAILKLKCTYMPIDINLPVEQIRYMLTNTNACAVVSYGVSDSALKFCETPHIDLNYDAYDENTEHMNLNYEVHPNDPAYVMHTSGSTGRPKGVVIPHRALIRLLINTNYIALNTSDVILFHSNTSFDAAIFEIWAALLNGGCIVISPHLTGDIPAIF